MKTFTYKNKTYETDDHNFLIDHEIWDKNFSIGMAYELGMLDGLTEKHWEVIHFIRKAFKKTGERPLLYETCRMIGLKSKALQKLFPTGYLRGACLLAGLGYKGIQAYSLPEPREKHTRSTNGFIERNKAYRIDIYGFLLNPEDWDEEYAIIRAYEMNIKGGLNEKHWQIIYFLRDCYKLNKNVPTIYDCCEANEMDIEDIEELFPAGYHRCAIKIAGLPSIGVDITRKIL